MVCFLLILDLNLKHDDLRMSAGRRKWKTPQEANDAGFDQMA